ncbi:MAG: hypothetical protein HOK72_01255 [Flavobacteriales bacterium]|jgi:hypothetical protein|nr:hypothetical protein [Flavobacteriales bacterium]
MLTSKSITLKKSRIILGLCISLITGIIIGKLFITYYEASTIKPWGWNNPPFVLNCYGERLHPVYIEKAVEYWKDKGEKILFIQHTPIKSLCKKKYKQEPGVIKIFEARDDFFNSPATLGLTSRKASIVTGMISANIYIKSGNYTIKNLLTHEMGHAFGYTHIDAPGHVMHPITEFMGDKFWIP